MYCAMDPLHSFSTNVSIGPKLNIQVYWANQTMHSIHFLSLPNKEQKFLTSAQKKMWVLVIFPLLFILLHLLEVIPLKSPE